MGKTRPDPLETVKFRCGHCKHRWSAAPDPQRTSADPDRPWHPWAYTDTCPNCGREADQDGHERNLLKAWAHATGPTTPDGLAATSANLDGHPTPEEAKRTRFNALKHGAYAQTATYFPARPGQYPHCDNCQYFGQECREPGPGEDYDKPLACLKRTELYMQHYAAVESGDPAMLMGLRANTMATFQAILDDMMLAVIARGVELVQPEWYFDPKGEKFHLVSYEDAAGQTVHSVKVSANPLLKIITEWMRSNNITWADMNMTPKVQADNELLSGYLDKQPDAEGELAYQKRMAEAMEGLTAAVARSAERKQADPVLIEYQEENRG